MDETRDLLNTAYAGLKAGAEALPDHSEEDIRTAVHHLKMMEYQCPVDFTEKDFLFFTKRDLGAEFDRIATLSEAELRKNPSLAEDWPLKPTPADIARNRIRRMEFLFREYRRLYRLRSKEPEAWDQINELYYDD